MKEKNQIGPQECIWNEEDADNQIETTSLCQVLCLDWVSLRSFILGNTQAHKVSPHPCSVGTAEVHSVNQGKGENHGKDRDYTQINVAPLSFNKNIQ